MSRRLFAFLWILPIFLIGCAFEQTHAEFSGLAGLSQLRDGISQRSSSSDPDWQKGNADARRIMPGETLILADLQGPGVIRHLWNTIAAQDQGYSRLLALRIYWDGEPFPSVECPIGDFFGVGHGKDIAFESLPVSVSSDGRARNCYWPMPFRNTARITVTNEGTKDVGAFYYYVDWQKMKRLDKDEAYFHASYRQEFPAKKGSRFLIADIRGRGHYVGTVQSVRQRVDGWYGEGDDFFYIDGDAEPTLRGTGTEDYFCDAWGFREFTRPFYGVPLFEGFSAGNKTSVYRWHILDPIRFRKSLRVEIEHVGPDTLSGGGAVGYGERPDDFSTVAFWYQTEPHALFPPLPYGRERFYPDIDPSQAFTIGYSPNVMDLYLHGSLNKLYPMTRQVLLDMPESVPSLMSINLEAMTGIETRIHGSFQSHEFLEPNPAEFDTLLAPGEKKTIPVALTEIKGSLREWGPLISNWTITVLPKDAKPLEFKREQRFIFDAPFVCEKRKTPVTIDGNLTEWDNLPYVVSHPVQIKERPDLWTGPADCSFRFSVACDDEFLYAAVDVKDDILVLDPGRNPWQQDGIELRVNAMPDPGRSESTGSDEFKETLLIALSPGETPDQMVYHRKSEIPSGVQAICVKTKAGHASEIAIPFIWLDEKQGAPWKAFRFNVCVDDVDETTDWGLSQLWWRPDWRTPLTYSGSGMFYR